MAEEDIFLFLRLFGIHEISRFVVLLEFSYQGLLLSYTFHIQYLIYEYSYDYGASLSSSGSTAGLAEWAVPILVALTLFISITSSWL